MLDDMQRKAEAATAGPWDAGGVCIEKETGEGRLFSSGDVYITPPDGHVGPVAAVAGATDAAYIASASPDVVLRLIAVARAAKAAMDSTRPATEARSDWAALRESLAALEAVGKKEGMGKQ